MISSTKEVVFSLVSVCVLVGFLVCQAGLHKNYRTNFHKTWMEDESRPRTEQTPLTFAMAPDKRNASSLS